MAIDRVMRASCDHPSCYGQRLYRLRPDGLREELKEKGWLTLGSLHFCGPGDKWEREHGATKGSPDHARLFAAGEHRPKHRRGQKGFYGTPPWIPGCVCGWSLPGSRSRNSAYADHEWLGEHARPVVFGMPTSSQAIAASTRAWHEQQAKLQEVPGDGEGDHGKAGS